jgi:hypothetical protein
MLQHGNRIRHERGNDYVSELEEIESPQFVPMRQRSARNRSERTGQRRGGQAHRGRKHD